jgi:magnesium transporter
MVMLTELLRFMVTDRKRNTAPLVDFSVALLDEDYPPVTKMFFEADGKFMHVDCRQIERIDLKAREIRIDELGDAEETEPGSADHEVLLKRDVLDAMILDLLNRRTTRANDLQLDEENGRLSLKAVDAGFSAMLRRISRGYYNYVSRRSIFDWKYVEFLRGDPKAVDNGAGYNLRITHLAAGEIAQLTNYIPYLHAAELLTLLPDPKAADTLEAMPLERQIQVIEEFSDAEAAGLIALMSPDLAAGLVRRLQTATMKRYLELIPRKQSERIIEILHYPEDVVGGVMINDMVYAAGELTVAEARDYLCERLKEPDFVTLIYIVDTEESRRLRGVISLRQLLVENGGRTLEEIMDPYLATLDPHESALEAAHRLVANQFPAMPVVGEEGRLIGVMTIDAAIAQIAPQTSSIQGVRIFS